MIKKVTEFWANTGAKVINKMPSKTGWYLFITVILIFYFVNKSNINGFFKGIKDIGKIGQVVNKIDRIDSTTRSTAREVQGLKKSSDTLSKQVEYLTKGVKRVDANTIVLNEKIMLMYRVMPLREDIKNILDQIINAELKNKQSLLYYKYRRTIKDTIRYGNDTSIFRMNPDVKMPNYDFIPAFPDSISSTMRSEKSHNISDSQFVSTQQY